MTMSNYCHKHKTLADALGNVGQAISDETFVLTMLRGLNDQYATMATLMPMQSTFPTFIQARSLLLLE